MPPSQKKSNGLLLLNERTAIFTTACPARRAIVRGIGSNCRMHSKFNGRNEVVNCALPIALVAVLRYRGGWPTAPVPSQVSLATPQAKGKLWRSRSVHHS